MFRRLHDLCHRVPALQECSEDILKAYELLKQTYLHDRKILLCGNGGSAADSDHWAGELLKGFGHPRPLPQLARRGLPSEIADRLQWALPAIPLTGFSATSTAFGNDVDPQLSSDNYKWLAATIKTDPRRQLPTGVHFQGEESLFFA